MSKKIGILFACLSLMPAAALAAPADAPARISDAGIVLAQAKTQVRVFARGDVLPEAYRAKVVKNPYHQGLKPPPRDQQWVQVGRTFYLIERETGKVIDRVDV